MNSLIDVDVNLLDEGTDAYIPCMAKPLGDGLYELIKPEYYDPEDQYWQHLPGSVVRLKEITDYMGERRIVATHPDPRAIEIDVRTRPESGDDFHIQTYAIKLGEGRYEVQPTPHYKSDEKWDYPPGSVVKIRQGKSHGFDWIEADGLADDA